jgi:hypothetical protein
MNLKKLSQAAHLTAHHRFASMQIGSSKTYDLEANNTPNTSQTRGLPLAQNPKEPTEMENTLTENDKDPSNLYL